MGKARIRELKSGAISILGEENVNFPRNIWINEGVVLNPNKFSIKSESVLFHPLDIKKNRLVVIETESDLYNLFQNFGIEHEPLCQFRIAIRDTKTMGKKPLFVNGLNSKKNYCEVFEDQNVKVFMLFSLNGTRALESIYIHGIWEVGH